MKTSEIRTDTLTDRVYHTIKEKISNLELKPGIRLKQEELCRQLGVSSSPVREALNRLEKDSWLECIPRRGRFVRGVKYDEIMEIMEVREYLEVLASQKAALLITEQDLEKMRRATEEMAGCISLGDMRGNVEADMEFHQIICRASGNKTLTEMFSTLLYRGKAFVTDKTLFNEVNVQVVESEKDNHIHIIEALEKRDIKLVVEEVHRHFENVRKCMSDYSKENRIKYLGRFAFY